MFAESVARRLLAVLQSRAHVDVQKKAKFVVTLLEATLRVSEQHK